MPNVWARLIFPNSSTPKECAINGKKLTKVYNLQSEINKGRMNCLESYFLKIFFYKPLGANFNI